MRVKIFASTSVEELEREINIFLSDKNSDFACYADIKYSSSDQYSEALLIYHEKLGAAE